MQTLRVVELSSNPGTFIPVSASNYSDTLEDLAKQELEKSRKSDLVQHEVGVAQVAAEIAERVGIKGDWLDILRLSARFHDIGKLNIETDVLRKKGALDPLEREHMQSHTTKGVEILSAIPGIPPMMLEVARYHHERYDGHGYEGIAGESIPFAARIVAIADVHDALLQKRDYKEAMPEIDALEIMTGHEAPPQTGRAAFDPVLLRQFVTMRLTSPAFRRGEQIRLDAQIAEKPYQEAALRLAAKKRFTDLRDFAMSNPNLDFVVDGKPGPVTYARDGRRFLFEETEEGRFLTKIVSPLGELIKEGWSKVEDQRANALPRIGR